VKCSGPSHCLDAIYLSSLPKKFPNKQIEHEIMKIYFVAIEAIIKFNKNLFECEKHLAYADSGEDLATHIPRV